MNHFSAVARGLDLFSLSLVFGATFWFFFVQAPVLFKQMGRERFVPLQMRLTIVFFRTTTITLGVTVLTVLLHQGLRPSWVVVAAVFALVASCINQFVVVPRALKAGGRSMVENKGKESKDDAAQFASEGAGEKAKTLHRTVVFFVVLMLAGVVAHGIMLLFPSA